MIYDNSWKPLSIPYIIFILIILIGFIIHALTDEDGFLLLDYINLSFHEFGHILGGIFGDFSGLWGGTIIQLLIPLIILISFRLKGDIGGVAFSIFWIGENLLYISHYIADARRRVLPLVGGGEHDWNIILSDLGMLKYDILIAGIIRVCGWIIISSSIVWFLIMTIKHSSKIHHTYSR